LSWRLRERGTDIKTKQLSKGQHMRNSTLSALENQRNRRHRIGAHRMRLSVMAMLISVTSLLGLGVTFASAASASSATVRLIDDQTGRCLDSNSSGSAYTLPCNGGNFQNWYEVPVNVGGDDEFIDAATGRCLDSNSSGSVYTLPCNGGNYQHWAESYNIATGIEYIIDDATGRALDSNYSGNLYTNPPSGGDNYQNWYFD
jgi:hypothetical protein